MKLYLVETVSTMRMRYVVEAREESHALDEVVMETTGEFNDKWIEFSQQHVGEDIFSSRKLSEKEYLELFDKDYDFMKNVSLERKMSYINKIDYKD